MGYAPVAAECLPRPTDDRVRWRRGGATPAAAWLRATGGRMRPSGQLTIAFAGAVAGLRLRQHSLRCATGRTRPGANWGPRALAPTDDRVRWRRGGATPAAAYWPPNASRGRLTIARGWAEPAAAWL